MAAAQPWTPYNSLTQAPTNLKEAIDWVLRVTGKDGKTNKAASPPQFSCICFLAKAVKDLLYDAKDPEYPGPSPDRNWDGILLDQEKDIVLPVLTDLGLVNSDSTIYSAAGGTEVIKALIDQLAQGLQKWVGWQEKGDECCLKGEGGGGAKESKGIGRKCECTGGAAQCCTGGSGTTCHECSQCGTGASASGAANKCYLSAYCKKNGTDRSGTPPEGQYSWPTISSDSTKVHLLARIFLGSVCLIWSGLSQLGFLTGGSERWEKDTLSSETKGLGSFMAAMGYDLDRLNQGSGTGKGNGEFVQKLLTKNDKGVSWKEFQGGSTNKDSVAEYYSGIYDKAYGAGKSTTEQLCEQYPLLVLHILASGYFRAGSAGANKVTPAKPATTSSASVTPSPRKPRTIREILYWLSALPYCDKYRELVQRMGDKTDLVTNGSDDKNKIVLHGEGDGKKTDLHKDKITHYLMAACGYCPLVLIGIQGTIATGGNDTPATGVVMWTNGVVGSSAGGSAGSTNKCPEHKKNPSAKRCKLGKDAAQASAAPPAASANGELKEGEVCYGGYHLAVKDFGPLHGMYANGLFGFQMDLSAAQCLDQLRIYVYHCFYQLYFLRKQCTVGVAGDKKAVLGWQSYCGYVRQKVSAQRVMMTDDVAGTAGGTEHTKNCGIFDGARSKEASPLQSFLCDAIGTMVCNQTIGVDLNSQKQKYPEIDAHMNKTVDSKGIEHPAHLQYPQLCPVPMGWSKEGTSGENHFKGKATYPIHCTGRTLSLLLEYYCDPEKCQSGTLVVLLRLLACITPTVPRTLGDLFGFYYYVVYIGGNGNGSNEVKKKLGDLEKEVVLYMGQGDKVVEALTGWSSGDCQTGTKGTLKCLTGCNTGAPSGQCSQYLSPLSGQQYGQLSPLMAGTYLSWLVYLIEKFEDGLKGLAKDYRDIVCRDNCSSGQGGGGCSDGNGCRQGTHGTKCTGGSNGGVCQCASVVSCTGVLPVLYKYGFGYGNVTELHKQGGVGVGNTQKKCHEFLSTLNGVLEGNHIKHDGTSGGLHHEINKLIYTTRLPWIFVLTLAWLVAVLYLAFGAIWPLDWTHMRSHCRGWFRKGSLSPWEVLMVGKKKGRGILEYFGKT
uniref:Variant erythrocyte surface antigen-1, beta subunit n=1 Tax=Babesia bovis TaxID=5865 RepID=A7AT34_BABBO|eukprot:XP_001609663.1 variant erythrocyte surface antigen-1, beta subunit [Babesia bovis T2Bo]